jgi:predicted nuclease with RNAse H fold
MEKVYIGIDPTANRRPMNYAILNDTLDLVARGEGKLDEVVGVVHAYASAVVAVDAPQSPNGKLMKDPRYRAGLGLPPKSAKWANYKVCEYELRRRGIRLYNTPADALPRWMQTGFELYKALYSDGFQLYQPASTAPRQVFEVHPHAIYTVLLGRIPLPKDSLEGRMQRQLLLYQEKVEVPDPMSVLEEITRHHLLEGTLSLPLLYTHDELDALISAYAAQVAALRPEQVTRVGDAAEGQIVIPVAPANFKDTYL